jgi:ectoine hydroxylase-related dioxygenase (phytanoyl-CoA dioxygenase family)
MISITGADIKRALDRDGYAVVKDVFSAEEIGRMRDEAGALIAANSRCLNGGLCSGPAPRDSDLARRLLHDTRLASPWDGRLPSQIHVHADTFNDWHVDFERPCRIGALHGASSMFDGASAWVKKLISNDWHADSKLPPGNAKFSAGSAWIYKITIFLQDHPEQDGLSLIPGSHNQWDTPRAPMYAGTLAGDIVIFNTRIKHAGRFPNRTERLIETLADSLHRVRLVDYTGRQRLQYRFRRTQHWLNPAPERLAIFLFYATHKEIQDSLQQRRSQASL